VVNAAPTAAFTGSAQGLTLTVDGGSSADVDGSVVGYAWSFGDGASGSGRTASHTYASAGTYPVTLTVTDDGGATATATQQLTVSVPEPVAVIAEDTFNRSVTGGLGVADVGGQWTVGAGGSRQSVAAGVAELGLPGAGNNTGSYLGGLSQTSADVRTSFSLSSMPTGSGTYVYLAGRRVGVGEEYRVRVRVMADGSVAVALSRLTAGLESFPGGEVVVPGLTFASGATLNVRMQVAGVGTTDIRATVWAQGAPEPGTPQLARTDSTAALQAPGGLGIAAWRPSTASAATAVRFTSYRVTALR
jgi:PKD repeat protein